MPSAHAAVAIENLSVTFGETRALSDVSLHVEKGELVMLLGPSGCGKSTLLRSVAGFVSPTSGVVRLDGEEVTRTPPHQRHIGMVFQSFALFPHLDVAENVAFGLRERRVPKPEAAERVERALADVRMKGYGARRVDQLSGGEQQRVALARALVTRPRCLLLDEPLSNLDAGLRHSMREEIRRVCKEHELTTLYVTHDQKEALAVADRIAVLRGGHLLQVGSPLEVYRAPNSRGVATFLGETNLLPAEVEEAAAGELSLRVGPDLRLRARALGAGKSAEPKQTVLLSIRPECVRLARAAHDGAFPVSVKRTSYLGELSEHELEHGSLTLRSYELNPSAPPAPGEQLWASVAAGDVVVLPADRE